MTSALVKTNSLLKQALLIAAASALLLTLPLSVLGHGDDHEGSSNDRKHHSQQVRDSQDEDGDDHRGWWRGFGWWKKHKPKQQEDPPAQTCEERQAAVNQSVAEKKAHKQLHLALLAGAYQGIQNYVTQQSLTVANYDALKAAVDSAQANAGTALAAVAAPTIDCNQSVEQDQVAVKEAFQPVWEAIHAYHQALFVGLLGAVEEASGT